MSRTAPRAGTKSTPIRSPKAPYTIRVTVPQGFVITSDSTLRGVTTRGAWSPYHWDERAPMASHLVTVDIDRFAVLRGTGPNGLPLRTYAPADIAARVRDTFRD